MTAPVLIIGASSAIGAAIARQLSSMVTSLHVTARRPEALVNLAQETGALVHTVDALIEADIAVAVNAAASGTGALSGVIYCPGSIVLKPLSRVSAADMADAYALNVIGAALTAKHAAPALKKGGGALLFFSTIAVAQGFANHTVIATAKGAVEGLTRSLAAELSPEVRVNCIAPSLTDTPLARGLTANPSMADAIAKMHPIPRLGTPADHAALAAFLVSSQATWITGQVFHVDGGRSTLRPKG